MREILPLQNVAQELALKDMNVRRPLAVNVFVQIQKAAMCVGTVRLRATLDLPEVLQFQNNVMMVNGMESLVLPVEVLVQDHVLPLA